jgi:tRNA-intron endonuclease
VNGRRDGDRVLLGGDARQRFHDNSGYGEPVDAGLALTPVEAAHLLDRGDVDAVDGDGAATYLRRAATDDHSFLPTFTVYADLRDRGFYPGHDADEGTIQLPPRGTVPAAAGPEERRTVVPVAERAAVAAATLGGRTIAAVDDDGDVTYLRTAAWDGGGDAAVIGEGDALPEALRDASDDGGIPATVAGDHVLLDAGDAAETLHDRFLLGTPTAAGLLLTASEAVSLDAGVGLDVDLTALASDPVEDAVYADLRDRGLVPRTGFKFGADLRAYERAAPGDEHAALLVRSLHTAADVPVRELARMARLARGVRKRLVFGIVDPAADDDPRYVWVERDRP